MLSLSCLSFDFMGTSYDESSDEIGTVQVYSCVHRWLLAFLQPAVLDLKLPLVVQVPSGWKPTLEDSSTLQIFFDYYAMNQMFSKEVCLCWFI